jgi:hypothetical protein
MRKVVVPVSIVALALALWLSVEEPARDSLAPDSPDIAPVLAPLENDPIATEGLQAVVAPDVSTAIHDVPSDAAVPPMRWPYQDPGFRDGLIGYLMANGLSEFDSARIADQAVDGLVACAVTHGWNVEERRAASPRCDEDVLQQAGLNEPIRLAVLDQVLLSLSRRMEAGRNIARSRAMQASAEMRARQAVP